MKYIKYFETIEEYETWINVKENAEEAYRTEEKICVDGIILSHTNKTYEEVAWKMIYEWLERNRKDIDILTSFLVTVIPIIMLYSEALGITENTIPYCILMIILGIASHYASRIRGEGDVENAKKKAKRVLGYPSKE